MENYPYNAKRTIFFLISFLTVFTWLKIKAHYAEKFACLFHISMLEYTDKIAVMAMLKNMRQMYFSNDLIEYFLSMETFYMTLFADQH